MPQYVARTATSAAVIVTTRAVTLKPGDYPLEVREGLGCDMLALLSVLSCR